MEQTPQNLPQPTPPPVQPIQPPQDPPPPAQESSGRKFPTWLIVLATSVITAAVMVAAFAFYLQNQTQVQVSPTLTQTENPGFETEASPAPNGQIYKNEGAGFQIEIPPNWKTSQNENHIGFRPAEMQVDDLWGISFYNKIAEKSVQQIKNDLGSQFADRKQVEEPISINGLPATKIVTTTSEHPDWYLETVLVESGHIVFVISNGATADEGQFEDFYRSFKLTDSRSSTSTQAWQTYTNTAIGYQVDYPPGWQAKGVVAHGGEQLASPEHTIVELSNPDILEYDPEERNNNGFIFIQSFSAISSSPDEINREETTINGIPVTIVTFEWGNKTYNFSLGEQGYLEVLVNYPLNSPELKPLFDQIVETVKKNNN